MSRTGTQRSPRSSAGSYPSGAIPSACSIPKHEQAWDLSNPTPAARHNEELFVAAFVQGNAPGQSDPRRARPHRYRRCRDELRGRIRCRAAANTEGLRRQVRQDLYADVFLVELLLEGRGVVLSRRCARRGSSCRRYAATRPCRGLFQKEALQNIGWREACVPSAVTRTPCLLTPTCSPSTSPGGAGSGGVFETTRTVPCRAFGSSPIPQTRRVRSCLGSGAFLARPARPTCSLNPGVGWGLHRTVPRARRRAQPALHRLRRRQRVRRRVPQHAGGDV